MYSMGNFSRSFGNPWSGGFGGGGGQGFGFGGFPSFNFGGGGFTQTPPRDPRLGPERAPAPLGRGYFQDSAQVAATPESGTVKQPAPTGGGFNFGGFGGSFGGGFPSFSPWGGLGFGGGFGGFNPWANPFMGFGGGYGMPMFPYM